MSTGKTDEKKRKKIRNKNPIFSNIWFKSFYVYSLQDLTDEKRLQSKNNKERKVSQI